MPTYNFTASNPTSPALTKLETTLNDTTNLDVMTGYNNQKKMLKCGELLLEHINATSSQKAIFCAIRILNIERISIYSSANYTINIWKAIFDTIYACLPNNAYIAKVHIGCAVHMWGEDIEEQIESILQDIQEKLEHFDLSTFMPMDALHLRLSNHIGYLCYPTDTGALRSYKPLTQYVALSTTNYFITDTPSHTRRFSQEHFKYINQCIALEKTIFQKIKEENFELTYQVQINVKTNTVMGAESLSLFHIKDANTQKHIDIIENSQYIIDFTQISFRKLVTFLKKNVEQLPKDFHISFNLSRSIFKWANFDLIKMIERELLGYEYLIKYIQIEVTESAYLSKDDSNTSIKAIRALHQLGFSIAIDDFGSGYGSLNIITSNIPSVIKVDKNMTQHICQGNKENDLFIHSLLYAAKQTEFTIIAEGVETQEEEDILLSLGIEHMQGYKYSKNLTEADFLAYLQTH